MSETTETSMQTQTMRWYRSKVDWWLALVLCAVPLVSISSCVALVFSGKTAELPWGIGGILIVFGVYFGLIFPMRYGLDETHLLVRFGLCRQRILLADISEVSPTHNPLSSPALSLDRLHIQYGKGFFKAVMISPADHKNVLDDLAKNAGLKREGNRLFRG